MLEPSSNNNSLYFSRYTILKIYCTVTVLPVQKKKTFFGRDGLWGDQSIDPFQMALRAALWTIATSGKALDDCKRTALVLYRNLVSTEVCTNNKKTVLLNVLLYCPGSTVPGYTTMLIFQCEIESSMPQWGRIQWKKHCKSFLQSSAQNFEPYKPDNAILRYQNQHARQLGLDFPSFTN